MKAAKNVSPVLMWGMIFCMLIFLDGAAFAAQNQSRDYFEKTGEKSLAVPHTREEELNSKNRTDLRSIKPFEIPGEKASFDASQSKSVSETVYLAEENLLFASQVNAPQNLIGLGLSTSVICLSWDEVPNASGYEVYCYWGGSFQHFGSTINTWFWDWGNQPNTSWTYYVTAVVNGVESGSSNTFTGTTLRDGSSYLSPPSNVSAEGITKNEVFLSWDPVANAERYNIYWYSDGAYQVFDYTSDTGYFDSQNAPGSDCIYKITAVVNGAESGLSSIVQARTLSDGSGYINGPENFNAVGISRQDIYLTWEDIAGADYYNVYCYYGGSYHWYDSASDNHYMDDENEPGTTWSYYITAVVDGAESGSSNEATGTTLSDGSGLISAPSGLEVNGSEGGIYLEWTEVSGAESYNIYAYIDGIYYWGDSTTNNYYLDTYVDQGVTYQYAVSAVKDGYESDYSSIVSGSTSGSYTLHDLSRLAGLYGTYTNDSNDLNGDGIIDLYDLMILAKQIAR